MAVRRRPMKVRARTMEIPKKTMTFTKRKVTPQRPFSLPKTKRGMLNLIERNTSTIAALKKAAPGERSDMPKFRKELRTRLVGENKKVMKALKKK